MSNKVESIDDQLYLLALVFTNSMSKLKYVLDNKLTHVNLNYVYKVPIYHKDNIVDELNNLMIINGCFNNLNEFIRENKLFQRLMKANNISNINPSRHLLRQFNSKHYSQYERLSRILPKPVNVERKDDENSSKETSGRRPLSPPSETEKFEFITVNLEHILQHDLLEETNDMIYFDLTLLQASVMMENEDMLQLLLEHGASLRPYELMKIHSIHLALYQNNTTILGLLLDKLKFELEIENYYESDGNYDENLEEDEEVNSTRRRFVINSLTDNNGYNPLHIAIFNQNEEAIDILCEFGADVNHSSELVGYPLIWALENTGISAEIVEKLLMQGAKTNQVDETQGYTALIVAILSDRLDLVRLLIEYGADVNQMVANQSICPIKLAIDAANQSEDLTLLEMLLKAGADPTRYILGRASSNSSQNASNAASSSSSAAESAAESRQTDLGNETNTNAEVPPAQNESQDQGTSTSLDSTQTRQSSPLIDAIISNNLAVVEMLLEYGADGSFSPNNSYSPMCTACYLNRLHIVELLINHKVDPTLNSDGNNTPLSICLSQNNQELALYLLQFYTSNESLNKQDENGDFALLYAALNRNAFMIRVLIKAGANPDLSNKYGATALWYCAYNNDRESFMELVPYCKNLDRKSFGIEYNSFQWSPEFIYNVALSPIEVAERNDHYSLVYLLKCSGARVDRELVDKIQMKYEVYTKNFSVYTFRDVYPPDEISETKLKLNMLLKELEVLNKSMKEPLSLARLCRNFIKTVRHDPDPAVSELVSDKRIESELPKELIDLVHFKKV